MCFYFLLVRKMAVEDSQRRSWKGIELRRSWMVKEVLSGCGRSGEREASKRVGDLWWGLIMDRLCKKEGR